MQTKFSSMRKSENTFSWGSHKTFLPYKIKAKQGWKFFDPGWNFPYNHHKILAQGWNLPCNEPLTQATIRHVLDFRENLTIMYDALLFPVKKKKTLSVIFCLRYLFTCKTSNHPSYYSKLSADQWLLQLDKQSLIKPFFSICNSSTLSLTTLNPPNSLTLFLWILDKFRYACTCLTTP